MILNTICPNAFHYKQLCENHLRCSGLDYSIVRPPQLVGEIGDEILTDYKIDQGDRVMGKISRYTLAKVVVDSLKASNIGNKITFECTGAKEKTERTVEFGELKEDEKNKVIKVGHIGAKRTYGLVLTTLLIYLGYLILNKCGYIK